MRWISKGKIRFCKTIINKKQSKQKSIWTSLVCDKIPLGINGVFDSEN